MFIQMFNTIVENKRDMESLRATKDLRKEIERLKKLMLRQSDKVALNTLNNINWLESKLKEMF